MLEEMYVYFDMPEPGYGIQLVYNNVEYPELVTVVREGDAVLMPAVSSQCFRTRTSHSLLWAMAAHREVEDRQFGVVNIQPGFDRGGSGWELDGNNRRSVQGGLKNGPATCQRQAELWPWFCFVFLA